MTSISTTKISRIIFPNNSINLISSTNDGNIIQLFTEFKSKTDKTNNSIQFTEFFNFGYPINYSDIHYSNSIFFFSTFDGYIYLTELMNNSQIFKKRDHDTFFFTIFFIQKIFKNLENVEMIKNKENEEDEDEENIEKNEIIYNFNFIVQNKISEIQKNKCFDNLVSVDKFLFFQNSNFIFVITDSGLNFLFNFLNN
jgi:hypothetical protein